MKKIILFATILCALSITTQAQFSTGNLLNKAKEKAKQKAEEKARQEAEKAITKKSNKDDKKEDKSNSSENTSTNETITEEQTTATPAADYASMNNAAYVKALGHKSNTAMMLDQLQGTSAEAIERYYKDAIDVDLANFYPIMQKKGKPTGFDGVSDYESLLKLWKDYPEIYETKFKPLVNSTIDEAYKLVKTNRADAVATLNTANRFNDACLMVVPDLKSALEMKAELATAITKTGGEQAKVYTSDFHKKNAGKVLFSKIPIVPGKENPTQFTTNFAPGEPIYAMAYLNGTIQEITNTRDNDIAQGRYILKVDGTEQFTNTLEFNHNKEDYKKAYFPIEVRPNPATAAHGLDATYFADRFGDMSPRKHTVGLAFTAPNNYGDNYAYGEIKIDWTNGDAEKMKADAKVAVAKAQDNYCKTVQLHPAFSKANYVFNDPALSVANLKKAIMASDPNVVQILKLVTIKEGNRADDWGFARNEYGTILGKTTNHFTSYVYKAKDGNCYTHHVAQFGKKSTGGGSYGALVMYPTGIPDERIACENVK